MIRLSPLARLGAVALLLLPAGAAFGASRPDDDAVATSAKPKPAKAKAGKSAKDKDDKPKWDVNAPPGPKRTVTIDTDEGTWMSVDVRPQGDEIVFDLLGDIYVIPIAGGDAKPLREGMAWEMQPRFSPDGEWIAFTSDAGGGDNIWVMRRDGSDARQVTKEDFRLVNSPTWTPDGEFIAARKHFSSERSLGTGEIWLFHKSGGKGVQMTKKTNDQKDLGEPAFSPDGRSLYWSEDATPGKTFEYNKDPHGQIYVIKRMDREDGRLEVLIDGAGGAVRPTPSPDGKTIAFVRRVGLKTSVFLYDLESGRKRPLWDGLDRDMQETWAIHGVYPTMSWTADSRSLILWAGGKIRRIDTTQGAPVEPQVIPFRVASKRVLSEALRFPVEVEPAKFHTRMLRWVEVAPDGAAVVYQALGKLFVRDLPVGTPRRLTTDAIATEMYASFSRDGKSIVYTTWNDDALGSVRVAPLSGGPGRTITARPGHYVEPVMSPDGKWVLYRRVGADALRSPLWSRETGIYRVAIDGEPQETLVTRDGEQPHFGSGSDRVYFTASTASPDGGDGGTKAALKSIELDGSDERTHATSEFATAFRVSPDGRALAFRELFNVYVMPFPQTGRPIDVGPKAENLPIAKVSRDAGDHLHWSGDSQSLHWSLGPELFTRTLSEAFASLDGTADAKAEDTEPAPAPGVDIGFEMATNLPEGSIALVGARIVTMRGDEVIEDGTIVVERNRITAVGRSQDLTVPAGAHVVDAAGMTITPGLVDVHYHGAQGGDGIIPDQNWSLDAALAFGVTTVHDPSSDTGTFFAAAELRRAGFLRAPRLFSTGTVLYGAKASIKAVVESLDDARSHLRRMKAVGAFSVKSYNQPRREQRQQVIAAARELSMMVVPEGGSLYNHNLTMVLDGHTGIEHALPIAAGYRDMVELWAKSEVGYTPTLVVGYGGLFGENYWYQHTKVWEHPLLRGFVPPFELEPRSRRRMMVEDDDWNHVQVATLAKKLSDAGVRVNVGAHGQREGLGSHWEMWMLAQGGMSPLEAIRAATLNGAHYLGLDKAIGSLEVGKLADLVVIDANPLADLRQSDQVRYTMVGGRLYDAATMNELGNHPHERAPFFWEEGWTGPSAPSPAD